MHLPSINKYQQGDGDESNTYTAEKGLKAEATSKKEKSHEQPCQGPEMVQVNRSGDIDTHFLLK